MNEYFFKLVEVNKWYGEIIAINDATITIDKGLIGLVGHNGAGKTTLIKMLVGLLKPSLGYLLIDEKYTPWDDVEYKKKLGYLPEIWSVLDYMTPLKLLEKVGRFYLNGIKNAKENAKQKLKMVNLDQGAWNRKIRTFSQGMRQRTKMALALINDPEYLYLDEPLSGIDPIGRHDFTVLFRELVKNGASILISTHILKDVDAIAQKVILIREGQIIAYGHPSDIRTEIPGMPMRYTIKGDIERITQILAVQPFVKEISKLDVDTINVSVLDNIAFQSLINDLLINDPDVIATMEPADSSVEKIMEYLGA